MFPIGFTSLSTAGHGRSREGSVRASNRRGRTGTTVYAYMLNPPRDEARERSRTQRVGWGLQHGSESTRVRRCPQLADSGPCPVLPGGGRKTGDSRGLPARTGVRFGGVVAAAPATKPFTGPPAAPYGDPRRINQIPRLKLREGIVGLIRWISMFYRAGSPMCF